MDNHPRAAEMIDTDLETINRWAEKWLVKFNPSKSGALLAFWKTNRNMHPPLIMNAVYIIEVQQISFYQMMALGMNILIYSLDSDSLNKNYISFVWLTLEHANIVWNNCSQYEANAIERIQTEAAGIDTGATRPVSFDILSKESGWESVRNRRTNIKCDNSTKW